MRVIVWLIRALVFFALFAFAVNNRHEAYIHWFFGQQWRAPMVFIVLAAFALGCAFGVFAMVPSWWKHRRVATRRRGTPPAPEPAPLTPVVAEPLIEHPPRDGL